MASETQVWYERQQAGWAAIERERRNAAQVAARLHERIIALTQQTNELTGIYDRITARLTEGES